MEKKDILIVGGVSVAAIFALVLFGKTNGGSNGVVSAHTPRDTTPSISPLVRGSTPYYRGGVFGPLPSAGADSDLPVCGCSGISGAQESYKGLIDNFNASLDAVQEAYTQSVINTLPTYFTQYLNNVTGAQASGDFSAWYV